MEIWVRTKTLFFWSSYNVTTLFRNLQKRAMCSLIMALTMVHGQTCCIMTRLVLYATLDRARQSCVLNTKLYKHVSYSIMLVLLVNHISPIVQKFCYLIRVIIIQFCRPSCLVICIYYLFMLNWQILCTTVSTMVLWEIKILEFIK
jgi:hypothetical protein